MDSKTEVKLESLEMFQKRVLNIYDAWNEYGKDADECMHAIIDAYSDFEHFLKISADMHDYQARTEHIVTEWCESEKRAQTYRNQLRVVAGWEMCGND